MKGEGRMEASGKRTRHVRLALMLILGMAAAAACVVALLLWKAPVASAQEEGGDPTGANFVVSCGFTGIEMRRAVDPIVDPGNPNSFHLHDFYGNTTTNENSTYDTLLAGAPRAQSLRTKRPTGTLLSPGPPPVASPKHSRLAKHSSTTGRV